MFAKNRVSENLQPIKNKDPREKFILEHSTCAMCDTQLEISHETDSAKLSLKEEAHCPFCGIRVRAIKHLLH